MSDEPDRDLFAVVTRQRACREFADTPVTDAELGPLLEAATHAPSAENRQPWEFVIVRDPETRAAIGELTRKAWEEHGRAFPEWRSFPCAPIASRMRANTDGSTCQCRPRPS